ncbi:MAG: hypothetical protein A3J18_04300 [Candidatus Levybacteria bacterium RIFCSPLOWO2_02_FULL_40_18]|nr:MAG: hypothetical protein A2695_02350 [Candidatus Levybacteria bacterium RIFCSPHIGHO2_01_FULL_40_83]OGH26577.1 MAG: hypothetical protein A3D82_03515 [Candidatus Levybacteria bacterium RIFCSPHIGHO2_02_FULL_40_29]OGH32307.1 MAG: hypothetical protein A3E70_02895 [Candidatus Levybacteria bacterium RIFCSPHIGHO2_12_FULL_40_44]OGH41498.1 MAG: hypothetical protein A2965_00360 [Candidatus Levybacteria bacterium RIFCSPLOWO2_01_FULL_40_96]OGH50277.1 MAG: hypothetical protein A3J18_04300 [Candidatus Lev
MKRKFVYFILSVLFLHYLIELYVLFKVLILNDVSSNYGQIFPTAIAWSIFYSILFFYVGLRYVGKKKFKQ